MPRQRSSQQNRFYHGVVIPHFQEAFLKHGHILSAEETHKWIKQRFGIESTTKLSTLDWEEFVIKLQAYASNIFGIQIPDPNEIITNQ